MLNLKDIKDPELNQYCKKINDVNLSASDFQEDVVLDFLLNTYSGYQQLVDALCDELLTGRKIKGSPVPIDNIKATYHYFYNTKHKTNIPFFDSFKDLEVLKEALVYRWKEKNGDSKLESFEEIAPKVKSKKK
ncbi:MAG: hypothetical protein ABIH39_05900 [Candidatus Margulisiibacteriota bacterium]